MEGKDLASAKTPGPREMDAAEPLNTNLIIEAVFSQRCTVATAVANGFGWYAKRAAAMPVV